MATQKQVEANRKNAKRSTGPRTEEGKDASKLNAIRHGILARSVVVPNLEDEADWQDHRRQVLEGIAPVGGLEVALANRVAELLWRIRRVAWHERNEVKKNYSEHAPVYWYDLADRDKAGGRELPNLDTLAHMARYEAHLQRALVQTLRELDRAQTKRRTNDGVADPPAAVPSVPASVAETTPDAPDAHDAEGPGEVDGQRRTLAVRRADATQEIALGLTTGGLGADAASPVSMSEGSVPTPT